MKKHCIAMLLAGGQGSRLYALTAKVAKPSLPFGGKYRIIDFPLSNCANSGIDTVGVLTQYQPLLLNRYIGSGQAWDLDSIDGGVYILPPYQSAGERGSWFSGTANAIYQNMDFIEMYDPDCVLILSGDHVYKMDYDKMLRAHEQAGAACTISVIQVSMDEASRFGIMNVGPDGFIEEFEEKPAHPKSDLASMDRGRGRPQLRQGLRQEHHPQDARRRGKAPAVPVRGLLARRRHDRQPLGREHGYALAHAHQSL